MTFLALFMIQDANGPAVSLQTCKARKQVSIPVIDKSCFWLDETDDRISVRHVCGEQIRKACISQREHTREGVVLVWVVIYHSEKLIFLTSKKVPITPHIDITWKQYLCHILGPFIIHRHCTELLVSTPPERKQPSSEESRKSEYEVDVEDPDYNFRSAAGKTVPFVELTVAHGSILTILAISFERYYAICKPLKAGYKCTKMRALIIIGIVWVVSILITSPILAIAEYAFVEYVDGSTVPVCLTLVQTFWQRLYFISITSVFFGIPFFILVTVYSFIAKHLIVDSGVVSSTMEQSQAKARRQVVMMLVAVVLSFFLCLLPFRVFTVWIIVADSMEVQKLGVEIYYNLLYFCRIMLYTNSAINPILYNLISSKFRDAFLRSLGCRKSRRLLRQATFTPTSLTLQSSLKSRSSHSSGTYNTVIPPRNFVVKGINNIL
ncbi:growth hormone secretagogue receptor type 1-like [Tachypleus tridentatus]|uniref:growth hormone secretagogue receptor type 1-like n=1 Tax=Tachypleus tridentatus TaxID=6853 RepID=UPI003FD08FCA